MIDSREHLFPIDSLDSLVNFIKNEADQQEPCLALASIVLGYYENALTSKRRSSYSPPILEGEAESPKSDTKAQFPILKFSDVVGLLNTFKSLISEPSVIAITESNKGASREAISAIADAIWNTLSQKFSRDKPHIQFLYSFCTSKVWPHQS